MRQRLSLIDKRLLTILLIVFVQILGASMVLPVLPLYAQRRFAMTPQVITLLITIFFAAQFVAGPFLGRLSDRYGRVPVLVVSQIGTAISFLMIGLAQGVEILFLARLLDGLTGGNIIVAQAYVTDITTSEERTQALGYIFAAFGLGFIIGPATGGVLSAAFTLQTPFLLAAVAAAAIVLLTYYALEESLTAEQRADNRDHGSAQLRPRAILTNYPLVLVLLVVFVAQLGFGLLQSTFALYGDAVLFADASDDMASLGVGLLLAVVGLGQVLTQMALLPQLVKWLGDAALVLSGVFLRGASMLLFALIASPWLAGVGSLIFAVGSGLMLPSSQAMATRTVDDRLRGGVLGVYNSAFSLAIIFGTALGGTLFEISPRVPFSIGGLLFMLTLLPGLYLLRWARSQAIPSPQPLTAPGD